MNKDILNIEFEFEFDVIGPFHDDRRHLGVLLGDIQIWESDKTRHIGAHLTDETLEGWANIEDGRQRWTTGSAVLDLSDRQSDAVCILAIEVLAGGPWVSLQVVDPQGDQVPAGEEGVVRISSSGLLNGYVDGHKTQSRHFSEGWFYPGDRGILDAGQKLRITGRVDDLVSLGGEKFDLGVIDDIARVRYYE